MTLNAGRGMRRAAALVGLVLAGLGTLATAASVSSFSPQGAVRDVRQVTVRFSEPMVRFGDPRLPDPFTVECAAAGKGRWADDRNWVYDFDADMAAGETCTFTLRPDLRALGGARLSGASSYSFSTGGPAIRASMPYEGSSIDENQIFVLGLDAPATEASIGANAYCAIDGLEERVPLKLLSGTARDEVLAQRRVLGYAYYRVLWKDGESRAAQVSHDALKKAEKNLVVAQCGRPLPNATDVRLVWGKGITAAGGLQTVEDQVLGFRAREAFTARFGCDRVNASAPCVPVLPMWLSFSAPVPRALAEKIQLRGAQTRAAQLDDGQDAFVERVRFDPPFPNAAEYRLELPQGFHDDADRPLANASSFPLAVATDEAPPLAKFSGEFGILERSEGGVLPLTVRDLEDQPGTAQLGGQSRRIDSEAEILSWMRRVRTAMETRWEDGHVVPPGIESVFGPDSGATAFQLPAREGGKAFEVIGIPLKTPGFHVVEIASPRLGQALLGEARPRYVATTALVTNLSVHFKWGREGSLVFVSSLDTAQPVADAQIKVVDGCTGTSLWAGRTGHDGTVRVESGLPSPKTWSSCQSDNAHPLMVSARKDDDLSFTLSDWNRGISPGDFNIESGLWQSPRVAHSVLDRALLRAGETVSMKHYWREQNARGLAVPAQLPTSLEIEHLGSGAKVSQPIVFDAQGIATSQWAIPKEAKLGEYQVRLRGEDFAEESASFRVEQYRIPQMRAVITPPTEALVAATSVPLDLYVGYFSGGAAARLPVKLRTQVRPRTVSFAQHAEFGFGGAPVKAGIVDGGDGGYFPDPSDAEAPVRPLPAQTLPLTLDANGSSRSRVDGVPSSGEAQEVFAELEYPDANGELTSVRSVTPIWPSSVIVGLSGDDWSGKSDDLRFKALVVDLKGKPLAGQRVAVHLWSSVTHSYRRRLVGGFYAYSHSQETRKLDASCSGSTDAQGLVHCAVKPGVGGQILLEATVKDAQGRISRAVSSRYVAGDDDWWFAQADNDRMDLIPEQREIEPGQPARLQVRMPFRSATALVTVEREGVLRAFVTPVSGTSPVIEVPMEGADAPNVYVSVLALRGRVSTFRSRFYDFLRWLHLDRWFKLDGGSPTALVDLSRPAYRLGITRLDVGWNAKRLKVAVQPEQDTYATRGRARVRVQVSTADGNTLPAGAEIAFSAVDEALLDLHANRTVDLLDRMMQRRGLSVLSATAQTQVVGRRHYGRKSLPPGGGGGRGAARELLDSLLLWQGRVPLDAQGHASVEVPLNDALSAFRLTAVASAGTDRFGTGSASIRTTQDIQLISGVPPLVRENDRFDAQFTVRNTTRVAREIEVEAEVRVPGTEVPILHASHRLNIPAGEALPASFELTAPFDAPQLIWTVNAEDPAGTALDALKIVQEVAPAFPVRVYQATLTQLEAPVSFPVERPADAIPGRGGLRVNLQASLTASLDPVRDWARLYPYACYEQLASRAVILEDRAQWDQHLARLSAYLDGDGLVRYFPSEFLEGSDTLTAYLLALAHEAGWPIPEVDRARMLDGLAGFVEGRVQRGSPLRIADQTERKLAALDALSRYGRARAAALTSFTIDPNLWHTSALIDWIGVLQRVPDVADRERRLDEAQAVLRARLSFQGTTMGFSAEQDDALWWLMISADVNANRAILALLPQPAWREDLPRMMRGAIGRQQRGHWNLTTANAWGVLATRKFAAAFEREPVAGVTRLSVADQTQRKDWKDPAASTLDFAWPAAAGTLQLAHEGSGKPWAIVQSRAALPLREPFSSGYRVQRTVTPVEQAVPGQWTRGDTARIHLQIDAQSDMTWVVVEDPVPGGATILGGGLGRDSQLLAEGESREGEAWPAFEERRFDVYRAYYAFVPKGGFSLEYTVRYNNSGRFVLPATRVEAMYAPEMLGELPNAPVQVDAPR